MHRALKKAGVAPRAIDFVHAHGTGTSYNDAMEGLALRSVFGANVPPYCSRKGLFGHTLGAAGLLETIVCLIAARQQLLPGTPGTSLSRSCRAGLVAPEAAPGPVVAAASENQRRLRRRQCRAGAGMGGRISQFAVLAASFMGREGCGNDRTGLRPWPAEVSGPLERGELEALRWSTLFDSETSRFGRMDMLSRLGLMAVELLDAGFESMEAARRDEVGVCVETRSGCTATDDLFLQMPLASTFAYTLPSTALGEICIRHRFRGRSCACCPLPGRASVTEGRKVGRAVLCPPRRARSARPTIQD